MTPLGIGFAGLGHMGGPMARRLLEAGYPVCVLDPRAETAAPLVAAGAVAAASPRELAAQCDVAMLCLPKAAVVEAVSEEIAAAGGARIVVDFSTTGPETEAALGERLAAAGATLIDCPVSGGPGGAAEGTLALLCSGDPATVERLRPALETLGRLFVLGAAPGMGQTMKLVNNLLTLTALVATSEAAAIGAKAGLDPDVMIEALNAGTGRNSATVDKFPKRILTGGFDFGMAVGLSCKDAQLIQREAERMEVPSFIGAAMLQALTATKARYGFEADLTMVTRLWEEWAGVEIRSRRPGG